MFGVKVSNCFKISSLIFFKPFQSRQSSVPTPVNSISESLGNMAIDQEQLLGSHRRDITTPTSLMMGRNGESPNSLTGKLTAHTSSPIRQSPVGNPLMHDPAFQPDANPYTPVRFFKLDKFSLYGQYYIYY